MRFLFVAASTRTSTCFVSAPPTRSKADSCRTRSTFACADRLISPTSSRKSEPPSASSNLPMRWETAPVKDPFSWPKSSLSMRSSGIAAQFTSTKGSPARFESSWSLRATSSLPVPFSPMIRTRAFVGATRFTVSRMESISGCSPIISVFSPTRLSSWTFRRASSACARPLRIVSSSRSMSIGFSRKSNAPSFVASTAVPMVPCPEMMMTGSAGCCSLSDPSTSSPSMPGILTSSSTMSTRSLAARSIAARPSAAVNVLNFSNERSRSRELRMLSSSSTMRTRLLIR